MVMISCRNWVGLNDFTVVGESLEGDVVEDFDVCSAASFFIFSACIKAFALRFSSIITL